MYSIYHFFKYLVSNKEAFNSINNLEDFPFDTNMLSCKNVGQFPDLAIRLNIGNELFTGGELIELKDSKTYTVSSFNSTIPSGEKEISDVIKSENSAIKRQMEEAGNHIYSLPKREVYYLIRGKHRNYSKIVLVHGSFFETVKIDNLISQSFEQVLDERLKEKEIDVGDDIRNLLVDVFSKQENFSRVRNVDKASVKLRFRIMTEVKAEGNILNAQKYPEIVDGTINLIVPNRSEDEDKLTKTRFSAVYDENDIKQFSLFKIKHHLNGYFNVFQQKL
ncbi:hypothetical protein FACS1894172_05830 [Spirochaetia bacterium]|nr:hypothetical protein FACS1894164_15410 [Spirochaetia bacterium]GHU31242.1 hypothetical protein FACS1894172_05830 [Spirochaetia bacterium]